MRRKQPGGVRRPVRAPHFFERRSSRSTSSYQPKPVKTSNSRPQIQAEGLLWCRASIEAGMFLWRTWTPLTAARKTTNHGSRCPVRPCTHKFAMSYSSVSDRTADRQKPPRMGWTGRAPAPTALRVRGGLSAECAEHHLRISTI
jgi:hypothetical protein